MSEHEFQGELVSAPDRDWADIIGTSLVVVGVTVAILALIVGFFWLEDRQDARRSAERMECARAGWLWIDDRCLPEAVIGTPLESAS